MSFITIDQFFGGGLGYIIGSPIVAGLLMLLFVVGLVLMLRLSFDAAFVNLAFVIVAVTAPAGLGGAGFLPSWSFYVVLMVAAVLVMLGFNRLFNR